MKPREHHKARTLMALLVVLAGFLFQARLGAVPMPALPHSQQAHHAQLHTGHSQGGAQKTEQHAGHQAHCLFCVTQAFSAAAQTPALVFAPLPPAFEPDLLPWSAPLFVAFFHESRAPPA